VTHPSSMFAPPARVQRATGQSAWTASTNVQREPLFVCNCCPCCCGFLRGAREFGAPHPLVRSNWASTVWAERCTACGACAGGRCPMDAIAESDGRYTVSEERCIGCGVCTVSCPADAITLMPRPPRERTTPPRTIAAWAFSRAVRRRGALRAAAQFGGLTLQAMWPHRATRRQARAEQDKA
jgi:ferredoxin